MTKCALPRRLLRLRWKQWTTCAVISAVFTVCTFRLQCFVCVSPLPGRLLQILFMHNSESIVVITYLLCSSLFSPYVGWYYCFYMIGVMLSEGRQKLYTPHQKCIS